LIPVVAAKGAPGAHNAVTQVCNNCAALAIAKDLAERPDGVSLGGVSAENPEWHLPFMVTPSRPSRRRR
jgi:hypothetical protein